MSDAKKKMKEALKRSVINGVIFYVVLNLCLLWNEEKTIKYAKIIGDFLE
jgi:hypothetical protein